MTLTRGLGLGLTIGLNGRGGGSAVPFPTGYRGAAHVTIPTATGLSAFETYTGITADMTVRFATNTTTDTTPAMSLSTLATYAAELPQRRVAHWGLPIAWSSINLAAVAAGNATADAFFASAATAIKAASPNAERIVIRPGWEPNHAGYAWAAAGAETAYKAAFARAVGIVRGIIPNVIIEWCVDGAGNDPTAMRPDNSVVDVFGGDFYLIAANDIAGGESSYDAFVKIRDHAYGLTWLAALGATHSKPIAISEFGVDTDEAYDWLRLMSEWMEANAVAWSAYWDESLVGATDYQDKISDNSKPKAGAEFVKRFGAPTISTVAAWKILLNQAWAIPLTSPQGGTWSRVSGTGAVAGSTLTAAAAASGTAVNRVKFTTRAGLTVEKDISVQSVAAYTPANATALAFVARLAGATLDEGYKQYLDTFCAGLSTDGLLTKLDAIWVPTRALADAYLNVKGTHGTITVVGTGVTWTPNRGFHGSKTGYLDLGFGGQRSGNVFVQNSALIGGYSLKDFATDSPFIAQANYSGVRLRTRDSGGLMSGQINDFTDLTASNSNGSGFFAITRTASGARAMRRETTAMANNTTASTGTNSPNFLGFTEDTGFPNVHEAAVLFVGNGMNATQMNNLRSRILTFLQAVVPGFA